MLTLWIADGSAVPAWRPRRVALRSSRSAVHRSTLPRHRTVTFDVRTGSRSSSPSAGGPDGRAACGIPSSRAPAITFGNRSPWSIVRSRPVSVRIMAHACSGSGGTLDRFSKLRARFPGTPVSRHPGFPAPRVAAPSARNGRAIGERRPGPSSSRSSAWTRCRPPRRRSGTRNGRCPGRSSSRC